MLFDTIFLKINKATICLRENYLANLLNDSKTIEIRHDIIFLKTFAFEIYFRTI